MANDYGPSFRAAKLYRRVSKTGSTYFTGRLGFLKIALVKSKTETGDDGSEVWSLMVSEAPQKTDEKPYASTATNTAPKSEYIERVLPDDSIPF